jgi:hypothetical protein
MRWVNAPQPCWIAPASTALLDWSVHAQSGVAFVPHFRILDPAGKWFGTFSPD